ncbi:MAG TPA: aminopeptidase [candidate division Zixibacteria bacterium]|nr:aminopeptidase [candidate division Zixibacteria bacterium]
MDPRLQKLAEVLCRYSLKLKKGQTLKIVGGVVTLPAIKAVFREAIEIGAHPYVQVRIGDNDETLLKYGSKDQLTWIPPFARMEINKIDAYLMFWGNENTRNMAGVDPKKQALARQASRKIMERFYERHSMGELRWCGTMFPTNADAQEADMSLSDYEDFVYRAGNLHKTDPVKHWNKVRTEQDRLIKIMNRFDRIHIEAPGTDLQLRVKGRKWINCSGHENFPDGEIFTSPIEDTVEGFITYSFPAIYMGREVENVRLEFKKGKIVNETAEKNQKYLTAMLDMDRGARYLGEVAVGTNYEIKQFSKNILFDEKIGGTCHLAAGNSFSEAGGKNKSGLHWDMICDLKKGQITADGKVIYANGKFKI